jgi:hypothetical protein
MASDIWDVDRPLGTPMSRQRRATELAQIEFDNDMVTHSERVGHTPRAFQLDDMPLSVAKTECVGVESFALRHGERRGRV